MHWLKRLLACRVRSMTMAMCCRQRVGPPASCDARGRQWLQCTAGVVNLVRSDTARCLFRLRTVGYFAGRMKMVCVVPRWNGLP